MHVQLPCTAPHTSTASKLIHKGAIILISLTQKIQFKKFVGDESVI